MLKNDSLKKSYGKIGLLTFHRTENFGSLLQTYGLYRTITKMGYDCEIIDYRCLGIEKREGLVEKRERVSLKKIGKEIMLYPNLRKKRESFSVFLYNNMQQSKPYYPDTIINSNDRYNKFIVGSDMVWGRDITENDYSYFLDFVNDQSKKYAFSSSVGSYDKRGDEDKVASLLKDFSFIAVREDEAVGWVSELSGMKAEWVCDPTMLLTTEEWNNVIQPIHYQKGYVLIYFTDNKGKTLSDAIAYARAHKFKVKYVNYGRPIFGIQNIMPASLEEFIGLIRNAEIIFTASYHGILFSLYYSKKFIYYNRVHASRMKALSERLDIQQLCGDDMDAKNIDHLNFKYDDIKKNISEFRNKSLIVLKKILEK